MNQERINEIVELGKNNKEVRTAFAIIDEVSKFLQEDKKFFAFASKQAKNNYVSPLDMIMLAHDYLNNTGKYQEWLAKKEAAKTTSSTGMSAEDKKFIEEFKLKDSTLDDMKKFATLNKIKVEFDKDDILFENPELEAHQSAIQIFLDKKEIAKLKAESKSKKDKKVTFDDVIGQQLELF